VVLVLGIEGVLGAVWKVNERVNNFADRPISVAQHIALAVIRLYQLTLSPWLGRQCRFYPTCSHYAAEAVRVHGVLHGCSLAARRLTKCHPFHVGGVDLVPQQIHSAGCRHGVDQAQQ
jgi:putative membrane protein insertion efficiency factor